MLTEREHFKIGVLRSCAERGFDLDQTHEVVKAALDAKDVATGFGALPAIWEPVKNMATWGLQTAGTGLLLSPFVLGGTAGLLAGRYGHQLTDEDLDEVKKRELITTYNQVADEFRRKQQLNERQRQRRSAPVRSLV